MLAGFQTVAVDNFDSVALEPRAPAHRPSVQSMGRTHGHYSAPVLRRCVSLSHSVCYRPRQWRCPRRLREPGTPHARRAVHKRPLGSSVIDGGEQELACVLLLAVRSYHRSSRWSCTSTLRIIHMGPLALASMPSSHPLPRMPGLRRSAGRYRFMQPCRPHQATSVTTPQHLSFCLPHRCRTCCGRPVVQRSATLHHARHPADVARWDREPTRSAGRCPGTE